MALLIAREVGISKDTPAMTIWVNGKFVEEIRERETTIMNVIP